jgi:hypothetical protein
VSSLRKVVILSEAKDLLFPALAKKQALRFAQDDNNLRDDIKMRAQEFN